MSNFIKKSNKPNAMNSWTFDTSEIANTFDSHVREQLPWYDMVTDAVVYIVRNYLTENNTVVDIGASTGNMIHALMPLLEERNCKAVAIEKSPTMVEALEKRFSNNSRVKIIDNDILCHNHTLNQVYIVFLTMMFIPVHERERVLNNLKTNLLKGGVIVIVDKVCDHSGYFATVLKRLGMHWKIRQGAEMGAVTTKEMSLAGVQIPFDPAMLGTNAKQFFRMGEFVGWVIEA
jgi:tRNA (cmo5U34)-methyltransferase